MNTTSIPVISQLGLAGQADTTSPVAPSKTDSFSAPEMSLADFQRTQVSDNFDTFVIPETPIRNPLVLDEYSLLSSSSQASSDALLEEFLVSPSAMPDLSPVSNKANIADPVTPSPFLSTPLTPDDWHRVPSPVISSADESNGCFFGAVEGFDTQSCSPDIHPLFSFNADDNGDACASPPASMDSQLPSPADSDSELPHNPDFSDFDVQIPITPFHTLGNQLFSLDPQADDSYLALPTPAPSPFSYSSPFAAPISPSQGDGVLQPAITILDSCFSTFPASSSSSALVESRNPARRRRSSRRIRSPYAHESPALSADEEECLLESARQVTVIDEDGEVVMKHQCSSCGVKIGRAPDLKRHMLTCLLAKKYHCRDVVLYDGTIWKGCKALFSRRDACYRHLRRRLEKGCCTIARPPRPSPQLSSSFGLSTSSQFLGSGDFRSRVQEYQMLVAECAWRKSLPADEKNRLADEALEDIKQPMFEN